MKITWGPSVTVEVDSADLPPVAVVRWEPGEQESGYEPADIFAIGQRAIDHREGFNVGSIDRKHYEHQLREALAALVFMHKNGMP